MLAVIWPLQRAVTLRDPIPMCAAASRRRRCTCSAFSSAITRYVEDAADRGDSGAAVLRVHGMIARTSVAGKMTVGGCNRALQGAAGALPRLADRTASWLARACLGLDCHELSWQSSRSYSRVRMTAAAAAHGLCAPHSPLPPDGVGPASCAGDRYSRKHLICTKVDGYASFSRPVQANRPNLPGSALKNRAAPEKSSSSPPSVLLSTYPYLKPFQVPHRPLSSENLATLFQDLPTESSHGCLAQEQRRLTTLIGRADQKPSSLV